MGLVDTHCHLHFDAFDEDRHEVMQHARSTGVDLFINVGTDVATSQQCLSLANKHDDIYATAGIHPHDTKNATEDAMHAIENLLAESRVIGIGEIGLDYYHNHSPKEVQHEVFVQFIKIYHRINKPLILHCRDAFDDQLKILRAHGTQYQGIFHCFSANKQVMAECLDLGFHISFAGPLTYKKNDELREACRECPPERLMIETDAPYLPPQSKRGKRNEPAYMLETAETMAALHGLSLEALGRQIHRNVAELFELKN